MSFSNQSGWGVHAPLTSFHFGGIMKPYNVKRIMEIGGLAASLHVTDKLPQKFINDEEASHGLPTGTSALAYPVDVFPASPSNWMHGSSKASSYFLAVEEEKGMWLNFNYCTKHTHEVAVVVSIQGINPITGQKQEGLSLEQYHDKCPVHKVEFQQDNFCPECKYSWPKQNYISTNVTPSGIFWIDGFRTRDGKVRQYIFSEEEIKGIAAQSIGKDRVFAIGIAFYVAKEMKPKPEPKDMMRSVTGPAMSGVGSVWNEGPKKYGSSLGGGTRSSALSMNYDQDDQEVFYKGSVDLGMSSSPVASTGDNTIDEVEGKVEYKEVTPQKRLEIGAGALINQQLYDDTKPIDYWEETPSGMIYINYVDQQTVDEIIAGGCREEKAEGFMDGMTVGTL